MSYDDTRRTATPALGVLLLLLIVALPTWAEERLSLGHFAGGRLTSR